MEETFGIGRAIEELEKGYRVGRAGWNGKGMWLFLVPGPGSDMGSDVPFVAMRAANGMVVPWTCSQSDLLARDWSVCGEPLPDPKPTV